MRMSPVMLELMVKNIPDIPHIRSGELIAARVLQIEGEMLLLLLNSKTVLRSKLVADVELLEGQEITLEVKDIKDDRIELVIASRQRPEAGNIVKTLEKDNIQINREIMPIAQKLVEDGLPVNEKTLDYIQRAIKHITYLQDNTAQIAKNPIPAEWDVENTSLDQIVKWMVFAKEDNGEGHVETNKTVEGEKLLLLMEELTGTAPEDIIKLRKFGLKLTPYNIITAKNLRENKGFLDMLLKSFFGNGNNEETDNSQPLQQSPDMPKYEVKGKKPGLKTLTTDRNAVEDTKNEIKPIDITKLLERTVREQKDNPKIKAAAELLTQKTVFLNKSLAGQDHCILPFLFDGQVSECVIRRNVSKSKNIEQKPDVIELELDTHPSYLGRVKAVIRSGGKDIDCSFFVESDGTKALIEKNKNGLLASIKKAGFRITEVNCTKFKNETHKAPEKFVDLKV